MGSLARCVLTLFVALVAVGCSRTPKGPDLVQLHGLMPRTARVGETLEIRGRGLPDGVPAEVVFEGSLHRAGHGSAQGVRVVATARPAAGNRIAIPLTEELHAEFCGAGERSEHTTFRGKVVTFFVPQARGSARVRGTLSGVVLELQGGTLSRDAARRRNAQASRVLAALGLELGPDAPSEGLLVRGATGRAAAAGLAAGDLLLELDGLHLRTHSDFRPTGDSPWAALLVRRRETAEPITLRVRTEGLGPRLTPARMLPVVAAWFGAFLLVFWLGPADRVTTWASRSAWARIRRPAGVVLGRRGDLAPTRARWTQAARGALSVRPPVLMLLAALAAATTALALGGSLVAPNWDVWVLTAAIMAGVGVTGVLAGGSASGRGFLLWSGLVSAARAVVHQTPTMVAVLGATLVTGHSSLSLAVQDQAGFVQRWAVFRNPGLFLSFLLVWITLIPQPRARDPLDADPTGSGIRSAQVVEVLDWLNVTASCALVSILYLAGWALPWPLTDATTAAAVVGGVVVFQIKCWLLVFSVVVVRRWVVDTSVSELTGLWSRTVVPLSVGALVLTCAYRELVGEGPWGQAESWVSWLLVATSLAMAVLGAWRFFAAGQSRSAEMGVSPWL